MKAAYFISSHGFGHAARSAAIMEQMRRMRPGVELDLYSGTPEWFFLDSHLTDFRYHPGAVDVGLEQKSPMEHDLPASIRSIRKYLDEMPGRSDLLAAELRRNGTDVVIWDISPLGLMAAKKAGLPCVLFGNFTWDWIYEPYEADFPEFHSINEELKQIFALPDLLLQSEPLCGRTVPEAEVIPPAGRAVHESVADCRRRLGIPEDHRMGLITMGGIPEKLDFIVGRQVPDHLTLVLSGSFDHYERLDQMILLSHHSDFYHPDLVNAADFLIGKAGYSTIAEVCCAGTAYGCISRANFRESGVTSAFLAKRPNTLEVDPDRFRAFTLEEEIGRLLEMGKTDPQPENGAVIAARRILDFAERVCPKKGNA